MADELRDIDGDYKAAYVAEYEAYKRAGRTADAATVAGILRDRYGLDVEGGKAETPEKPAVDLEQRGDEDEVDVEQYRVGKSAWYELPDGEKVQGEDAARKALQGG